MRSVREPENPLCFADFLRGLVSRPAQAGVTNDYDDSMATLRYHITCGPQQLAKYLADMRMLVLNLEEVEGDDESGKCTAHVCQPQSAAGIALRQAGSARTLGFAYIHLSLVQFGASFVSRVTVYAGEEAQDEVRTRALGAESSARQGLLPNRWQVAVLQARLFVTFTQAGLADADLAEYGPIGEIVKAGEKFAQARADSPRAIFCYV